MSQQTNERSKVLDLVYQSIEKGMTPESVGQYVNAARIYGKNYNIQSSLIQDWLMEGRKTFYNKQQAQKWADSLP